MIGRNRRTRTYLEELERDRGNGVAIIGYLDVQNDTQPQSHDSCSEVLRRLSAPYLGCVNTLPNVIKHTQVDEVFITLPLKSCYEDIENAVAICEQAGIAVSLSVDLFERNIATAGTGSLWGNGRITYSCVPYSPLRLALKRLIDFSVALVALTVLAVPMLVIAAIITATSKGPIFFKQRRVGRNNKTFNMLKFRTMVQNAEALKANIEHLNEVDGPVFKVKHDPRITPIGRFLRKFSLDELPQFLNILRGDMSLVGPRPPIPAEVDKYEWWQRRRLSMKPGLTCFWQVMGRNHIGFEEWMRLDLKYIDNWSLSLDLKLLLRTIPVVLRGSGAS